MHFGGSPLANLQKKFWAHFHDLCVQKKSCLLWSSHAFRKFPHCQVCEICSGQILMVHVNENDAVCRAVQTQFRSIPLARLMKSSERIFMIYVSRKQTFLTSTFLWKLCKMLWARFTFLCAHQSLLHCSGSLWSFWHFIRMLWIWTHFDYWSHKLWRALRDFIESNLKKTCTGTTDMFCEGMNSFCEIWVKVICLAKLS